MKNPGSIIKHFNLLLGELEGVYHDISLKMGLSDSVSRILYTLCVFDGRCPLSMICRQTGMSKQTVNSAMRKLEEQGLVILRAAGGKNKEVFLTDEGAGLADRTARRIMEMENHILRSWKEEDVQRYMALTEEFLEALRRKMQDL